VILGLSIFAVAWSITLLIGSMLKRIDARRPRLTPRNWQEFLYWPEPMVLQNVRNNSDPSSLCDVMNRPAAIERMRHDARTNLGL
jgi:hypothetical protein